MMRRLILVLLLFCTISPLFAQAGPTYFYVVTAVSASGPESQFSNEISATFAQSQHIVTLNWVASTSVVTGYNIYRGTTAGGPYIKINAAPVAAVTYVDTFVLPNAPTGLTRTIS